MNADDALVAPPWRLSVVGPCLNDVVTAKTVIDAVLASPWTGEVIVVHVGFTDGTLDTASSLSDPRVRVFAQPRNMGKGAALRRGLEVGISHNGRTYAEGNKITWRDGLRSRSCMRRYSNVWPGPRESVH